MSQPPAALDVDYQRAAATMLRQALDVDYQRAAATMLRQLQTLDKAFKTAQIEQVEVLLERRPNDRRLIQKRIDLEEAFEVDTAIDVQLAGIQRSLENRENEGSQAAVDALLLHTRRTEQQYQQTLAWNAPDEPATDDVDSHNCIICLHNKRAVICLPCGHLDSCKTCWRAYKNRTAAPTCHKCRAPVTHTLPATQQQRDAADANDGQAQHGGTVHDAAPPGTLYMSAQMPSRGLAAIPARGRFSAALISRSGTRRTSSSIQLSSCSPLM